MKPLLFICILLIFACRKVIFYDLAERTYCDSCSIKSLHNSLNEIKYICLEDSALLTNVEQWRKYLHKCVTLDSSFTENIPSGKYEVLIKFEISDSNAVNPTILNHPEYGLGEKGLIIFNSFKGKWNLPAEDEHGGKIVYRQPFVFEIEDE